MHAPDIPIGAWWAIAVAATLVYTAIAVPMMPTLRFRIQICFTPLTLAVLALSMRLRDFTTVALLIMYSAAVLGLALGLLGRGAEMRTKIADKQAHGDRPSNGPSASWVAQFGVAVVAVVGVGVWLVPQWQTGAA